jgi:hypothetical protein
MRSLATVAFVLLATAAPAQAIPLKGDVVVRNIGEDRVAVLIDSDHDDKIDQGFLLTSDLPVSRMSVYLKAAELEFNDSYVRLIADNKLYDLYVAGHPDPPAAPKEMRAIRFIGYALQHSTGDSRCTLTDAREGDVGACYKYGEK